jgi:hypothetical protein
MTAAVARKLIRRGRSAALSTLLAAEGGRPYVSLVTTACDLDGAPILLLSDLSDHTRNLAADPRAALLFEAASRRVNPQTGPRISVVGTIIARDDAVDGERLRRRFLARHPGAALYAGFADFHVYRMMVERGHYVGGFARAQWIAGHEMILSADATQTLAEAEADILARINADQAPLLDDLANRVAGRKGTGWRLIALDPEGCDLARRGHAIRLDFPAPATTAEAVQAALRALVEGATPPAM